MSKNDGTKIYAIFHLNLAFSSIDEDSHLSVIEQCYWPILKLIETHEIPLGLELSAFTLESIENIAPKWVDKFRQLLAQGKCELLASGDSQIIGPLVPAEVNAQNLNIGQLSYKHLLGVEPKLAYINEQAVSCGLLDVYLDAGFETVVIEWDNPYSQNPLWSQDLLNRPQSLETASKRSIKVIWNNAIAFQKLQRYAHGELILDDYLHYLNKTIPSNCKSFSIYGSDAEIFDFRPGRYATESTQGHTEWQRLSLLFKHIQQDESYHWCKPSETLIDWENSTALKIATTAHPISVKKQAKYNITRWALSGKNDLLLNTHCFKVFETLHGRKKPTADDWRSLCRLWASDLRTHLTQLRYDELIRQLPMHTKRPPVKLVEVSSHDDYHITFEEERNKLHICSPSMQLTLNANRGLSIEKLAFASQDFKALCGTLPHGHFDHIAYAADFYSNHLVMERFRERDRVTDLSKITYTLHENENKLLIRCSIDTPNGELIKCYQLDGESLTCSFEFTNTQRPEASLRLGYITLLDCDQRPWFACHNGGYEREVFNATNDFDHGAPVSSIVSASSAVGATKGEILFGSGKLGLKLSWNPSECAPLPLISSKKINDRYLNRLCFSLIEADETLKEGGSLPAFSYCIRPSESPLCEID